MPDLFTKDSSDYQPLAARMRPRHPQQYVGQQHIFAQGKPLRQAIDDQQLHSMVLWGPPGVGKTSMARMIAEVSDAYFESLSAVLSGVKDIRLAVDQAKDRLLAHGRRTLLFVDEVHRFNKGQQDAFLPHIEDGSVIFIGATTENPSFSLNNALLSRCRVYVLKPLDTQSLIELLESAINDSERGLGNLSINYMSAQLEQIALVADGDARAALNALEICVDLAPQDTSGEVVLSDELIEEVLSQSFRRFDKGGDLFYEQISALHKSVRGSDPDASLYWYARMIDGGCDPLYLARRLVRMASEDIGNADPRGLEIAINGWMTMERLGSPEGELALAQVVVYLASAPKSNAVYAAYKQVMAEIQSQPSYDVPEHLRNAPTQLMKSLDYGAEYRYAHDQPGAYAAGECYFPEEIANSRYYFPVDRGLELKIRDKLARLQAMDEASDWQRYSSVGQPNGVDSN